MTAYVLDFADIDQSKLPAVGGKGAALGELARIDGIPVPPGFCITTAAFRRMVQGSPAVATALEALAGLGTADGAQIAAASATLRAAIETEPVPADVGAAIAEHLARLGTDYAYAVRSSATAEDLPGASAAGQQDSYLNVVGVDAVLAHVRRCWASLYSERAVLYRQHQGLDPGAAQMGPEMGVVVQRMVFAEAAGVLFTADPVSGNRRVTTIDASFGLGEALVAGQVNPDVYRVRTGRASSDKGTSDQIIARQIAVKQRAVVAVPGGGTQVQAIAPGRQRRRTLTEAQVLGLARLGRAIEAHFGRPQDIEWCLADGTFSIVQSRPITTLFPIPASSDDANRVYVSAGHQQMMTDAMTPLGLAFFLLVTPAPMRPAGGRLFVDVTNQLAAPASRKTLLAVMGQGDPLMRDALQQVARRKDFLTPPPAGTPMLTPGYGNKRLSWEYLAQFEAQPERVPALIEATQASLAALQQAIAGQAGPALFDFIREDIKELRRVLFNPQSSALIQVAFYAAAWLNTHLERWLAVKNAADTLSLSVPHNVTSAMGLALLDTADVLRRTPAAVAVLARVQAGELAEDAFLDELGTVEGGDVARVAIEGFLAQYGMRCPGEIDITRTRWQERPARLVPLLLGNIHNFAPGEAQRRFDRGLAMAQHAEHDWLAHLRALPGGGRKADETERMIRLLRAYIGYREYPKYGMISRYLVYKQALLREAERLVAAGVLAAVDDAFYLTFDEFAAAVRDGVVDAHAIATRRQEYRHFERLTPPRVLTSDGEIITGAYRHASLPPHALAGLAVSAGVVEGRARILHSLEQVGLEPGGLEPDDILVTAFTDPGWTPLFVGIAGLVTEVGGLMTHGAVIAREYGLPAVVGVQGATQHIRDGQRLRVNGTEGWVEVL